jgi:enoyl-CoA hydratase/carnithine racemase
MRARSRSTEIVSGAGIGLFPDVGGSYFLPRLRLKHYGRHLALTGGRVKGAALKSLGVATHCVPSSALPALYDALAALPPYVYCECLYAHTLVCAQTVFCVSSGQCDLQIRDARCVCRGCAGSRSGESRKAL